MIESVSKVNKLSSMQQIGLLLGPICFLVGHVFVPNLISEIADTVLYLAVWMITWWVTEAVYIAVTSLLPLIILPLFNVMKLDEVGANYGSPIVFLFFGGFVLALALEKVNLHKRIALFIIKITGTSPDRVILGFMLATAFLSMWISNTATTVLMLPIVWSVINLLVNDDDGFTKSDQNFALCAMLGVAFSANAGGVATVIGTPPNSVLIGLLESQYNIQISFFQWMSFGVPFSLFLIGVIYIVMVKWIYPSGNSNFDATEKLIQNEWDKLGKVSRQEKFVLIVFLVIVFLWIGRTSINAVFPDLGLSDPIISIIGAVSLFSLPSTWKEKNPILQWEDTKKLAWGILLLFGGGLALANAMSDTGIIDIVTNWVKNSGQQEIVVVFILLTLMLFMTELMSNVALVAVLAPILAGIAIGFNIPLLHLLVPVTIASSCAFMLPMATPPNAIVFASGFIKVKQMVRVGFILNSIAILALLIVYRYIMPLVFS